MASAAEKVFAAVANDDDKVGIGNTQIVIPGFMKTYCKLFEDSGIMQALLPRKINSTQELQQFNPYLLDGEADYDEADFEGINEVSIFYINSNLIRASWNQLMTYSTQVAKDGGQSWA